jgi:hypothetical protein
MEPKADSQKDLDISLDRLQSARTLPHKGAILSQERSNE